jgi:hypothetical protein
MFDPNAGMPRLNQTLVYLGACISAGYAWREKDKSTFG